MQNSDAPIEIVPHDPSWLGSFETERALVERVAARWLVGPIEHIGSTAVPGLAAKPVIDVMAPIADLDSSRPAITALAQLGYLYAPYRPHLMHWFCKPSPAHRTHHLHLVPYRSAMWNEKLAFRDCLRRDAHVARRYAELKHRLAEAHRFDREAYTDGKGAFIVEVTQAALGVPAPVGSAGT